jgi:hypothetical protein
MLSVMETGDLDAGVLKGTPAPAEPAATTGTPVLVLPACLARLVSKRKKLEVS